MQQRDLHLMKVGQEYEFLLENNQQQEEYFSFTLLYEELQ
jgi:hypothetical protein